MSDLELTKLCAAALEIKVFVDAYGELCIDGQEDERGNIPYDPLHDDAQAMALLPYLVSRGGLTISESKFSFWEKGKIQPEYVVLGSMTIKMIRECVCECVANMQKAKSIPSPSSR